MHDTFTHSPMDGTGDGSGSHTRAFATDDPLFENLVRVIEMQCLQYIELQGDSVRNFFAGMCTDVAATLRSGDCPPAGGALMVRDGLDRSAARAVIQALVRRGATGDDHLEEGDTVKLFLYRMLDNAALDR